MAFVAVVRKPLPECASARCLRDHSVVCPSARSCRARSGAAAAQCRRGLRPTGCATPDAYFALFKELRLLPQPTRAENIAYFD